ncbi:MAG: hypothetical protein PHI24_15090 [Desulfitobacteriaceae bacterium]|nr:hypothetical protein [Desulfitobacteriaceae bacterium]
MSMVINFIRGLTNSPIGSFVSQLLQIGILSTVWMFIGNMVKTMQRNIVSLTSTAAETASNYMESMPSAA